MVTRAPEVPGAQTTQQIKYTATQNAVAELGGQDLTSFSSVFVAVSQDADKARTLLRALYSVFEEWVAAVVGRVQDVILGAEETIEASIKKLLLSP